jgi:hypothetical protein
LEDVKQALMRNDITPSKRGDDGTQIQWPWIHLFLYRKLVPEENHI